MHTTKTTLKPTPTLSLARGGTERKVAIWTLAATASAFGPYLLAGVRTEQLVIYGSMVLGCVGIARSTNRWTSPSRIVVFLWSSISAIALVGALLPTARFGVHGTGLLLPGIDNVVLPLALLILGAYWLSQTSYPATVLDSVAWMVATLGATNALIASLQMAGAPIQPILARFWTQGGESVAVRALQNERFTGIFNQPAEAGLVYSLALLCLAFLWIRKSAVHPGVFGSLLLALIGGSLLSQSKLVLLVGIPVVAMLLLLVSRWDRRAGRGLAISIVALLTLGSVAIGADSWYGSTRLLELTQLGSDGTSALIQMASAGRYGESGSVTAVLSSVAENEPWFGFGAAGLDTATDSSWLEVASVAGFAGLGLYVVLIGYLGSLAARRSVERDPAWWLMAWGLLLIAVLGGFGLPIATANRGGTVFWILLIYTLLWQNTIETGMIRVRLGSAVANVSGSSPGWLGTHR